MENLGLEEMKISSATVRRLRVEHGWSQDQLATVSGLSLRTIQRVEAEGSASLETRRSLAAVLGVGLADIAGGPLAYKQRQGNTSPQPSGSYKTDVKARSGAIAGAACGVAGALIGAYFAWRGFSSGPYSGQELGEFWGIMGAGLGCTFAFIGTMYNRWCMGRHHTRLNQAV